MPAEAGWTLTELQRQIEAVNRDRLAGTWRSATEAAIEARYGSSNRLFVYGTLRPGASNHHVLDGLGGTWAEGTVRGTLSDDGWAASRGYPAITLDPRGAGVTGSVLVSARLVEHWARLDAFEGDEYCRLLAPVRLADETEDVANVYALRVDGRGPGGEGGSR